MLQLVFHQNFITISKLANWMCYGAEKTKVKVKKSDFCPGKKQQKNMWRWHARNFHVGSGIIPKAHQGSTILKILYWVSDLCQVFRTRVLVLNWNVLVGFLFVLLVYDVCYICSEEAANNRAEWETCYKALKVLWCLTGEYEMSL